MTDREIRKRLHEYNDRISSCCGKEDALALRAELHKFYEENHVTKEQREIIVFGFGERLAMLCSM